MKQLQVINIFVIVFIFVFSIIIFSNCAKRGETIDEYPDLYAKYQKGEFSKLTKSLFLEATAVVGDGTDKEDNEFKAWELKKGISDIFSFRGYKLVKEAQDDSIKVSIELKIKDIDENDEENDKYFLNYTINEKKYDEVKTKNISDTILELEKLVNIATEYKEKNNYIWKDVPGKSIQVMTTEVPAIDFLKRKKKVLDYINKQYEAEKIEKILLEGSVRSYKKESEFEQCTMDSIKFMMHPMNCVNIMSAEYYCSLEGGRLPTEEEWDYIYKAGKDTKYWWGDEFDGNHAVSDVDGGDKWKRYFTESKNVLFRGTENIHPFGDRCNEYGVCDMAGNVWEWLSTNRYDGFRKIKGGSWYYYYEDWYSYKHESSANPESTYINIGFRCVKDK